MPLVNQAGWDLWVEKNQDPYGKCICDVAREVMRLLDERPGEFKADDLVTEADKNIDAGGITGFMAGCVAAMVSKCHSRGDEFRRSWNLGNQIGNEGEKANEGTGILNPALLCVGKKETA